MTKHTLSKMVGVLFSTFALVLFANTLIADEHDKGEDNNQQCSNATLQGSYGLHATGTFPGGLPVAVVGRFTFDGKGNLTGKLFVRVAGNNIEPPEFTGTYSVGPDCTVTDSWGPPINSTHVSVIIAKGEGYIILSNNLGSGETVSGEARRQ
jgi:hypothetical protein